MRKFCITDSRSCKAVRKSFDSLRLEREDNVPPKEVPLRLRPVVAQCGMLVLRLESLFVKTLVFKLSCSKLYLVDVLWQPLGFSIV